MGNNVSGVLTSVASDMLEGLAFIFAAQAEDADDSDGESMLTAKLSFSGIFSGTLVVGVSQRMLPELAANMLGMDMDEEVPVAEQYDAFKEMLNVICGNLLPRLAGSQEVFSIDVPEIMGRESLGTFAQGSSPIAATKLEMDNGYMSLELYCEGDVPSSLGN